MYIYIYIYIYILLLLSIYNIIYVFSREISFEEIKNLACFEKEWKYVYSLFKMIDFHSFFKTGEIFSLFEWDFAPRDLKSRCT